MKFNLNYIIAHPEDKSPLRYDSTANRFVYESQHDEIIFDIINNIPIMVKSSVPEVRSSAHTAHGSTFDYVDHYEKDSEVFDYFQIPDDPATIHENRRLHEFVLSKVADSADSILDIGCGNGWVARHFSKRNKNIVSFDISLDNIQRVLKENPSPNHYGVKGDVLALPFIEESFDLVISAEVVEHVPNTALYIANIVTVLKKGGRAIISTPYNEKLQYSLCIHCNRSTPLHAHIHSFKEDSLNALVQAIPGLNIAAFTMSNKGLLFLRTHKVLKYLPFSLWRFIDRVANKIINKPSRLVYVLDKAK
jgi:2-polyprenyl-3-methyl-5-hydroxy-6-metoxy-1,4-benzoquinol methylase/uncharacterized protein YbaR (Trm112 family)